jgi:hypothetical protein
VMRLRRTRRLQRSEWLPRPQPRRKRVCYYKHSFSTHI